ncbi:class I SAM-dependent methyltransferase [Brevibacillus sp. SAFN-007a]|uniref:class I SAM-dependent methyltransferase n=1 Tax=Brevibacillus sp. SAFN-007a TaxID=3436862 RepID=UPI003F80430C
MALFDQEASTYDNWCNTPLGSFVDKVEKEWIAKSAQPQVGEKAVDLGCGTGIFTIWLAKQGLDVTGIDLSSEMLAKAQEKAQREDLAIHWIQADMNRLPFDRETFDLVIGNIVLEFVENPEKVVAEALRVLKKDGRLVIGLINKESYWGRTYSQKGKDNPDSVFAHAHFYSEQTIVSWETRHFASLDYGLFVTPENFENENQALELEKKLSRTAAKNQAGFIVVRWNK